MTANAFGTMLPELLTDIPGPRSRELGKRLRIVESPNITALQPPPIFWTEAHGANVRDADDNIFIDLTSGFGVATAGHSNDAVVRAIAEQAQRLPHALGDVYPADVKVLLLERLAQILPDPLSVSILASSGAEAVEAALKTALMRTGHAGVLAFNNSYHGLTYGALAATHRSHFRAPFEQQLFSDVYFASFDLNEVDTLLDCHDIGAVIIEPIQGRGGIIMPPDNFLSELRDRCDGKNRVLIFDEIYTGCGRTGRWLACENWNVIPDVVVIGKGLSGALPISACVGSPEVMSAWPESTGEAIHTSTFLGNPVACAAALAQLDAIEGLLVRAGEIGEFIGVWAEENRLECRGMGVIKGIVLKSGELAIEACGRCMREGVLMLAEGPDLNVLAITPPLVITGEQLSFALERIAVILSRLNP
ncbi:MAG TPA: aspartate aminotransferase family protein [Longimicrobiales bacterium]|nr:aspartate aminotransferase family protein [Longimicrobiales bacterium]